MSEPDNQKPSPNRPAFLAFAGLIVLVMLIAAAYGGFLLGQSQSGQVVDGAAPSPETVPGSSALTAEPPSATDTVEAPTETQIVEKSAPQAVPAASETAVPAVDATKPATAPNDSDTEEIDLATFYEVWQLVESEFDGELPEDKDRLYGAITGSLEAIDDSYTRFIRPEIAERMRDDLDGSVSGIGAIVRPNEDGFVEIVRPIDDQPADLAGLLAGDVITAVDGQSVDGLSFDEVLLLVRGPEGTQVTLAVLREGEEDHLEFSLVRAEFEVPVVEAEMIEQDAQRIAYVRLSSFTKAAEEDLEGALTMLLAQDPDGIILDLRDNGGGFLDQAVSVADLFLPEGIVLYERSARGEVDETFRSQSGELAEELPLVVLVNAGSASASEIVAGAVKDNGRGILVGEATFGKGSVQHVHTLSDGSELRVTIARWFTPNDLSIGEEGILPDLEVASPDDLGGENDTQLQRALEYIINGE